jgi:glycerate kinase
MGGGMAAFFGSPLRMGIEVVLDTVNFDALLRDTDLVFTGEGRLDSQSLRGKVVVGVARRAKRRRVPVIAIAGVTGGGIEGVYDEGVSAVFVTNRAARPFAELLPHCADDLALAMDNLMRFMALYGAGKPPA